MICNYSTNIREKTREEMWARQQLCEEEVNYALWEKDRRLLVQMAETTRNCTFVVDVHACNYAFASPSFATLLGYDIRKIETLEQQGDYLESRFHPDDLDRLKSLQVELAGFIYSLPPEERNDYKNIYSFRVLNAKRQYVNVTSRQQVLETSQSGKAWLILGTMELCADQRPLHDVACSVMNLKTGALLSPKTLTAETPDLSSREREILQFIECGLSSKEIADRLCISPYTVHAHRQNLLQKLNARNAIEAINRGRRLGIIS